RATCIYVLSLHDALPISIEERLLQVNAKSSEANLNFPNMADEQLHGLAFSVETDAAPTKQQFEAFDALSQEATPLIAQWKNIMSTDLAALNEMMRKESVPAIYIAPPGTETGSTKAAGESNEH